MANDYWAYLREENELKHYRTPGSKNGYTKDPNYIPVGQKAVGQVINGKYIYDDKVAAAQARGQARQQQASRAAKSALQNQDERQGGKSTQIVKRAAVYNKNSGQTDGGEYGKNVAIPGVEYKTKTWFGSAAIRNDRNDDGSYNTDESTKSTESFLGKKIQSLNNHANNSVGGKVAAAQARGMARQRQASRAAKERLVARGNSGGNANLVKTYANAVGTNKVNNEQKDLLKKQQLKWREDQTVKGKIKNAYNLAKEKTLGAVDSIKRKLAKKR
jgi:hypothetical protein